MMSEKQPNVPPISLFKRILGYLCIGIGVFALVTPLTPGAWLIFVGLTLLGISIEVSEDHRYAKWAKRIGFKIKKKVEEVTEELLPEDK